MVSAHSNRRGGAARVSYAEVGATGGPLPLGYHHVRETRVIGHGQSAFDQATRDLFAGDVQRRAGAIVRLSTTPLTVGTIVQMRLRVGPLTVRAPCVVVWAEKTTTRSGFAYGTLPGHPERGEERFELHLEPNGEVTFTITAFSAPARWYVKLAPPLGRIIQSRMTQRYMNTIGPHRTGT